MGSRDENAQKSTALSEAAEGEARKLLPVPDAEGTGTLASEAPAGLAKPAQPTAAEVLEALGDESDVQYASWEDLCEPGGRQKLYKLRNGKYVRYTTFIPLEKVAEIRLKAMKGGRFNNALFVGLLLKEVMIKPRIDSDEQLRVAMKADGMAMLDIVNEVQNLNRNLRQSEEEELGEL